MHSSSLVQFHLERENVNKFRKEMLQDNYYNWFSVLTPPQDQKICAAERRHRHLNQSLYPD